MNLFYVNIGEAKVAGFRRVCDSLVNFIHAGPSKVGGEVRGGSLLRAAEKSTEVLVDMR